MALSRTFKNIWARNIERQHNKSSYPAYQRWSARSRRCRRSRSIWRWPWGGGAWTSRSRATSPGQSRPQQSHSGEACRSRGIETWPCSFARRCQSLCGLRKVWKSLKGRKWWKSMTKPLGVVKFKKSMNKSEKVWKSMKKVSEVRLGCEKSRRDWRPVEGGAFFWEWVGAALVVHLQLALLVDCDVVLKWKVHRLSALVNPSRNVLGKSSKKSGSRPPKISGFFGISFLYSSTCSYIPLGSEKTPASLCGSLSWASST